jgi:MATE family multidrug resistance protein
MPMVLARATQSVITFADAVQIKHLGAVPLAAVATGGLNVIGFVILPMGTVFIVQSFVAQLVGRGERGSTRRFAWYGLALALVFGAISALAIPLIEPVLGWTGYSPELQHEMASYMTIRLLSVGAVVGVEALGNWYGGLGNTWMQMMAGIVTMVTAIASNWLLIDGNLGAPALGVDGAAWASTIACWLGFAVIAFAFWRGWGGATRGPAGTDTPLTVRELVRVLRFGLPNGLNWFLEFASFQLFVNGVLASLGDETVAALNAVLAVNSMSFMPAFGLASAGAILSGQAIGRGDKAAVWPQVKTTLALAMGWMGAIAIVEIAAPHAVLSLFDEPGKSGHLVEIGTGMLAISAAWQVFDAANMTFAETLRAAGDTTWTALARLGIAWFLFTPAAFIVVDVYGLGANAAMLCLVAYLVLLSGALGLRFRSGAWRRIDLIEPVLV